MITAKNTILSALAMLLFVAMIVVIMLHAAGWHLNAKADHNSRDFGQSKIISASAPPGTEAVNFGR